MNTVISIFLFILLKLSLCTRVKLRGLKSYSFAAPIDEKLRRQLASAPVLESLSRRVISSTEQLYQVENFGSAVLINDKQYPKIYESLLTACAILDIETPPNVFVKQNPVPNAYTLAMTGEKPFIVLHTSLIELMTPMELAAVMGHELGHLKCEHGVWLALMSLSTELLVAPLSPFLAMYFRSVAREWQRSAELTCDRAALLVCQDPKVVVSVIMKLCGGVVGGGGDSMDVDQFIRQAEEFKKMQKGELLQTSTHPLPVVRTIELLQWVIVIIIT